MKINIGIILMIGVGIALCQTVNNVRLVNHVDYMRKVIQDTVEVLEHRKWNLKLPEITMNINETVFGQRMIGTARFTNGFLVSINHLDVQKSTVQQVWSWNSTDSTGTVSVRATLRFHDVSVGYDVKVDLEDGTHYYTGSYSHPLVGYAFSINKNTHTDKIIVTAVGYVTASTTRRMVFLPNDDTADVLATLFAPSSTNAGVIAWGPDIFVPIVNDVITRVEFPTICYNCPIS